MNELIKVTAGALMGFVAAPIDWQRFADFKQRCYDAHIAYDWGGKDANCGSGEIDFTGLDCSGFVRTILIYAGGGPETGAFRALPDGSYDQGQWFQEIGFKPVSAASSALRDGRLRVNIHHADAKDETGHIWLAVNGHTVECFGGHGPGERAWNVRLRSGYQLCDLASLSFALA